MRQIHDFADDRSKEFCIHCGARSPETRDHAPSKVFLDEPLPANLPVVYACAACNSGFSRDEQYLACLIECIKCGHADPNHVVRPKIASTLLNDRKLVQLLQSSRKELNGEIIWYPQESRVENVILKLARSHVAFEINEPQLEQPDSIWFKPIVRMSPVEQNAFNPIYGGMAGWPEVGSRAMNRLLMGDPNEFSNGWLVVQLENYRYIVDQDDGIRVKIVIREYLACEVIWY